MFEEFPKGTEITLERHANYWTATIHISGTNKADNRQYSAASLVAVISWVLREATEVPPETPTTTL